MPETDWPYDADQMDTSTPPAALKASVFRCTECGDGARLFAWTHVMAHGPVGADGVIEDYDWTDDGDEVIEESVICRIHGEGPIVKLVEGEYTSAMIDGRFVSPTFALATDLLDKPDVKYDLERRELCELALRISGRHWKPASQQDVARFNELVEARTRQCATHGTEVADA